MICRASAYMAVLLREDERVGFPFQSIPWRGEWPAAPVRQITRGGLPVPPSVTGAQHGRRGEVARGGLTARRPWAEPCRLAPYRRRHSASRPRVTGVRPLLRLDPGRQV